MDDDIVATHLTVDEPRPCVECGEPTDQVDYAFEASLHPYPCSAALEADYWAWLVRAAHQDLVMDMLIASDLTMS